MSEYTIEGILHTLPRTAAFSLEFAPPVVESALLDLGIDAVLAECEPGLHCTLLDLRPGPAFRLAALRELAADVALRIGAASVAVASPRRPGLVTLIAANAGGSMDPVGLGNVLQVDVTAKVAGVAGTILPWALGLSPGGSPVIVDLALAPHVLICGQAGSGRTAHLESLLLSLAVLNPPAQLEIILLDPLRAGLGSFGSLPHLKRPLLCSREEAESALDDVLEEIEFRYEELAWAGLPDLAAYNAWAAQARGQEAMPYIVVAVDHLPVLLEMDGAGASLALKLGRVCRIGRAAGIHVAATADAAPRDMLPFGIAGHFPARVACRVPSAADSWQVLDAAGAEQLSGPGDCLLRWSDGSLQRVYATCTARPYRNAVVEVLGRIWQPDPSAAKAPRRKRGGSL
jgi:DNA segregation ATPase FtsK/SpoIIIE, S-DNA-T family